MDVLDRHRTYILGCVGKNLRARRLQTLLPSPIPEAERWSHVGILHWQDGWKVIESQCAQGCRELPLREWLEENATRERIEAVACPLDVEKARAHVGEPFPRRYYLAQLRQPSERRQKREAGVTCVEMVAEAAGQRWRLPVDVQDALQKEKGMQSRHSE